jgi:hypothetical protein
MKRKLFVSIILVSLLCVASVFAATTRGTPEYYTTSDTGKINKVVIPITFVTAAGTATFTSYTLDPTLYTNIHSTNGLKGFYLYKVKTNPGSTGPTNGAWDLDITEADGFQVSRNAFDDRSSTATQETPPTILFPIIENTWTISIGDNAVNDATVVVYLTFVAN